LFSLLTCISVFRYVRGYYPIPQILRKLYLVNKWQEVNRIIIEKKFKLCQEGYCLEKTFSSPYFLPHYITFGIDNFTNKIPIDYEYKGKLKIELIRKNKIVYTETVENLTNRFKYENGKALYTSYFVAAKIPFPLKGKRYENIRIRVVVLKVDPELLNYIDSAELRLFPDLKL